MLRFINLVGRSVPFGNRERAGEITRQIALHRSAGAATVFHSYAPDDARHPETVRWSNPFIGYDQFPAVSTDEFIQVRKAPRCHTWTA